MSDTDWEETLARGRELFATHHEECMSIIKAAVTELERHPESSLLWDDKWSALVVIGLQELSSLELQLSEARQKAIKECVTVLERREAEHLKNYRGGSDFAADYLHEIEQCTEALRALLKEKP